MIQPISTINPSSLPHLLPLPLPASVSDDVKVALLAALAAWLPPSATAGPAPAAVAAQLLACLKDTAREALRRAAARALLSAVRAAPSLSASLLLVPSPAGGAAEPCLKWAADGLAKPALRLDGVLGALVVARAVLAAEAAGGAAAVAPGDKTWAAVFKPDSALLAPVNAAKLPPADCPRAGELAEVLLSAPAGSAIAAAIEGTPGSLDAVCRLLVCAGLHSAKPARLEAQAAIRRLVAAPGGAGRLEVPLCDALRHWMNNRAALPVAVDAAATGDDATPSAGSLAMRFGEVLKAIAPPPPPQVAADGAAAAAPLPLDGSAVAALLLAGHHPALEAPMRRAQHPWAQLARRLGLSLDAAVHAHAAEVCAVLSGPAGLASPLLEDRLAGCGALGAAMRCAPTAMYGFVHVSAGGGAAREAWGMGGLGCGGVRVMGECAGAGGAGGWWRTSGEAVELGVEVATLFPHTHTHTHTHTAGPCDLSLICCAARTHTYAHARTHCRLCCVSCWCAASTTV